jgi:hypothetical protein
MTRCAGVSWRKGHCRQGQCQDKIARGAPKGQTFRKSRRAKPECNSGIRNRDLKEWLCLGSERTSDRIFGKTIGLEIMKRTVDLLSGFGK